MQGVLQGTQSSVLQGCCVLRAAAWGHVGTEPQGCKGGTLGDIVL